MKKSKPTVKQLVQKVLDENKALSYRLMIMELVFEILHDKELVTQEEVKAKLDELVELKKEQIKKQEHELASTVLMPTEAEKKIILENILNVVLWQRQR